MKAILILGGSILIATTLAWAEDAPNGTTIQVKENAINIPVGRILLAKRNKGYCAVKFVSSKWSAEESYAKYFSYYIPDSTIGFTDPKIKPREDEVYEKQPLRIIGRVAAARSQDKVFCDKIRLQWSGGPNGTAWVYFDEAKQLELAPTKWRDIRDVNVTDSNLKWFRYGDKGFHD